MTLVAYPIVTARPLNKVGGVTVTIFALCFHISSKLRNRTPIIRLTAESFTVKLARNISEHLVLALEVVLI